MPLRGGFVGDGREDRFNLSGGGGSSEGEFPADGAGLRFRGLSDEADEVVAFLQDEAELVDRGGLKVIRDGAKLADGKHTAATKTKVEKLLAKA